MASLAFPSIAKKATLSDGTTYGYVAVAPADPKKPTFLLLHGYPSSSYDWRNQIQSLPAAGFGVIVPDLLGYGDTDAPADVDAYRMKTMTQHIAEILDREGVSRCFAVSHDWGSALLSRLVTYIRSRLYGAVFVSVGYVEPKLVWDIDALLALTRKAVGYETYGYWPWHNSEEAAKDCDEHPASVFSLIYPSDPEDWKKNFAPLGEAQRYVRRGRLDPLPSWYSLAEYTMRDRVISKKGYRGPLNWYKAAMRGINLADEEGIADEGLFCDVPTLLVVSDRDYVTRADMQSEQTSKWAKRLRIETMRDCGHWIQLERPDDLQALLEEFVEGCQYE
ncbi:putative epoxide hydrolase [Chaetomium fimeti]|uniref:Epoxide hydrolase n=1 Tax=Chaetomium fimeti TaxID=1854472 RepID=A0AAE0LW09_9PEZI|nr:putative epoxide hydrolase [Chaetomium fimeti]